MIQYQTNTGLLVPQVQTVAHTDMEYALSALPEGEKRFKRAKDCGMQIGNCFDCETPGCDTKIMVRCSCNEHLCPKHRRKWLEEKVGKAINALRELKNPKLFVADSVEPEFTWENVKALRKEFTKGSKVHFYLQDARASRGSWEYRYAWIAEGREEEHSDPRVNTLPADRQSIEWALDFVCTALSDFEQCLDLMPKYLTETEGRHFVQSSPRKGRGRNDGSSANEALLEKSKLGEELRAILSGDSNPDGIEANSGSDIPEPLAAQKDCDGDESHGQSAIKGFEEDEVQGNLVADSDLAVRRISGDQFSEPTGVAQQASQFDSLDSTSSTAMTVAKGRDTSLLNRSVSLRANNIGKPMNGTPKTPTVRCPNCGHQNWRYTGSYRAIEDGYTKLGRRGPGPRWIPNGDIDLVVNNDNAYVQVRPSW